MNQSVLDNAIREFLKAMVITDIRFASSNLDLIYQGFFDRYIESRRKGDIGYSNDLAIELERLNEFSTQFNQAHLNLSEGTA